ncbi:hypothetical protein ABHN11_24405 [Brevibacillus centrosporus]|uniref:hypothetical protein n=1 Tax=Brevibacillus centrosporus TaxID=54910 RepID=UPI003D23E369
MASRWATRISAYWFTSMRKGQAEGIVQVVAAVIYPAADGQPVGYENIRVLVHIDAERTSRGHRPGGRRRDLPCS